VPAGVVTWILPVEAPAGTVAEIWVGVWTEYAAFVPLNRTAVAPVKFVPVTATAVPGPPLEGSMPVIVGGAEKVVADASFEWAEAPAALIAWTR
jgi:hypothetical protein